MTPRSNSEVPYHQASPIKKHIPQMCSIAHLRDGRERAKGVLENGILAPASTRDFGPYITAREDGVIGLLIVSLKGPNPVIPIIEGYRHIIHDRARALFKLLYTGSWGTRNDKLLPTSLVILATHSLRIILSIQRRPHRHRIFKTYREDVENVDLRLVTGDHLGLT